MHIVCSCVLDDSSVRAIKHLSDQMLVIEFKIEADPRDYIRPGNAVYDIFNVLFIYWFSVNKSPTSTRMRNGGTGTAVSPSSDLGKRAKEGDTMNLMVIVMTGFMFSSQSMIDLPLGLKFHGCFEPQYVWDETPLMQLSKSQTIRIMVRFYR